MQLDTHNPQESESGSESKIKPRNTHNMKTLMVPTYSSPLVKRKFALDNDDSDVDMGVSGQFPFSKSPQSSPTSSSRLLTDQFRLLSTTTVDLGLSLGLDLDVAVHGDVKSRSKRPGSDLNAMEASNRNDGENGDLRRNSNLFCMSGGSLGINEPSLLSSSPRSPRSNGLFAMPGSPLSQILAVGNNGYGGNNGNNGDLGVKLTPHLVKPSQRAFASSGLQTKKLRSSRSSSSGPTPATPLKKPLAFSSAYSPAFSPLRFSSPLISSSASKSIIWNSPSPQRASPSTPTPISSSLSSFSSAHRSITPLHSSHSSIIPSSASSSSNLNFTQRLLMESGKAELVEIVKDRSPAQREETALLCTAYPRFFNLEYLEKLKSGHLTAETDESLSDNYFEANFIIIRRLGRGAFADAFQVQGRDGKHYAVKKSLHPYTGHKDRLSKLEEVYHHFLVTQRPNENIVSIIAAWEQHGHLYIQMELCTRGSLSSYLDQRPVELDQLWGILVGLARGIQAIHSVHVAHLDLKPGNIFIDEEWRVKIGDFGMATKVPVNSQLDKEGDRNYIAPEILEGVYSPAADIFSFGLIMLEMTANVDLPENGPYWQDLRRGDLAQVHFRGGTDEVLAHVISRMLDGDYRTRIPIDEVLGVEAVGDVSKEMEGRGFLHGLARRQQSTCGGKIFNGTPPSPTSSVPNSSGPNPPPPSSSLFSFNSTPSHANNSSSSSMDHLLSFGPNGGTPGHAWGRSQSFGENLEAWDPDYGKDATTTTTTVTGTPSSAATIGGTSRPAGGIGMWNGRKSAAGGAKGPFDRVRRWY